MHWRFSCKFVTAYLGLLSIRFITGCAIHAAVLFWSCPAQCECPVWSQQAQSLPASISESHQQVFQSPRLKAEDLCHSSASLTGFQYRPGCFRGNLILSSLQNPYMLLSKKQRNKKKHTSGSNGGLVGHLVSRTPFRKVRHIKGQTKLYSCDDRMVSNSKDFLDAWNLISSPMQVLYCCLFLWYLMIHRLIYIPSGKVSLNKAVVFKQNNFQLLILFLLPPMLLTLLSQLSGNEKQAGQAKFKCLGVRNMSLLQRPEVATSLQVPGAGLPAPQLGT